MKIREDEGLRHASLDFLLKMWSVDQQIRHNLGT